MNDNKLICHISTTFNSRSGSAKRTLQIINKLIHEKYQVLLIVGKDNDIKEMSGVRIVVIPELIKKISPLNDILAYKKIRDTINDAKPNIVHTHLAKGGILGRLASRKLQCQVVHTVHGPTFPSTISLLKRNIYMLLERIAAQNTNHFVFVGKDLQKIYIKNNIAQESNSTVIYTARSDNQLDYKLLTNSQRKLLRHKLVGDLSNNHIMTYVGRIVPSKQHDQAIDVLYLLHKKLEVQAHLVIVGKALLETEKEYESYLHKKIKGLFLDDFVHFTGFREDILEIMDASDSVILPSSYEGLPNVIVEAVISQTPIISYDVFGSQEILGDLSKHLVVPQGDTICMANHIKELEISKTLIKEEYKLLKTRLLKKFSQENMTKQKLSLYKKIIK